MMHISRLLVPKATFLSWFNKSMNAISDTTSIFEVSINFEETHNTHWSAGTTQLEVPVTCIPPNAIVVPTHHDENFMVGAGTGLGIGPVGGLAECPFRQKNRQAIDSIKTYLGYGHVELPEDRKEEEAGWKSSAAPGKKFPTKPNIFLHKIMNIHKRFEAIGAVSMVLLPWIPAVAAAPAPTDTLSVDQPAQSSSGDTLNSIGKHLHTLLLEVCIPIIPVVAGYVISSVCYRMEWRGTLVLWFLGVGAFYIDKQRIDDPNQDKNLMFGVFLMWAKFTWMLCRYSTEKILKYGPSYALLCTLIGGVIAVSIFLFSPLTQTWIEAMGSPPTAYVTLPPSFFISFTISEALIRMTKKLNEPANNPRRRNSGIPLGDLEQQNVQNQNNTIPPIPIQQPVSTSRGIKAWFKSWFQKKRQQNAAGQTPNGQHSD